MSKQTSGIHHITAIVGDPQENVDFYAGVLGLRLVKKTINFDDPGTYHLYFGDGEGTPGTIITFFPWSNEHRQGEIGNGQVGVTAYLVPVGAMDFWEKRLAKFSIEYTKSTRFGETYLQFLDPHGLKLEIVERAAGKVNEWNFNGVTPEVAIKGFAGATLYSSQPNKLADVLADVMGLVLIGEEDDYIRFRSTAEIGNVIDIKTSITSKGQMGVGTVHHIAWRAENDEDQLAWHKHVSDKGFQVTGVRNRDYFKAIYFQEYDGILFEIATDPPGFAHDESKETMGEQLMLPTQHEHLREQLEENLIPIKVRELA